MLAGPIYTTTITNRNSGAKKYREAARNMSPEGRVAATMAITVASLGVRTGRGVCRDRQAKAGRNGGGKQCERRGARSENPCEFGVSGESEIVE